MFMTNPIDLDALLKDVSSGRIQLPDFQRGWVWDDDRIRGLLASISRRFPIGAVMTLSSGGDINFKTRLIEGVGEQANGVAASPPDSFLLDGQQRLTSLYQALLHPGPVATQDSRKKQITRWYYVDMIKAMDPNADREDAIISVPEDKIITRHFGREIFLDLSTIEKEYRNHCMPTERLLDGRKWIRDYNKYWNDQGGHPHGDPAAFTDSFEESVLEAFSKYRLPVINLEKETPKEAVCMVFEKVNTGGVTLTVFELVTASFAAEAGDESFSLRDDWNARKNRLHSKFGVLQGVDGDHFLQVVTLLTTQEIRRQALAEGISPTQVSAISCKKGDILRLSLEDYRKWADRVEEGFLGAAKFLHEQYVFTRWDVPYNTQLVPLAALYVELGRTLDPDNAKSRLERWYWSGVFGEMYGGNTETQYALDLPEVAAYVRGGNEPRLVTEANFIPERLLSLRTRNSAAYKGLYALQMKSGAADWLTAKSLNMVTWHEENIDIHHVFPVHWCQNKANPSVPRGIYDSVINKTPIDAITNKIIGGNAPAVYLSRLERGISPEKLEHVLRAHWISPTLLRSDQFSEFFVERGEAMMELIGEVMGKTLSDGREVFKEALKSAGLREGEAQESEGQPLEFAPAEEFDDTDVEYDPIGSAAYDDEVAA